MSGRTRTCTLLWCFIAAGLGGGCQDEVRQAMHVALGMQQGYLFYGFDEVARPGESAPVVARLQEGSALIDQSGRLVEFYRDGELMMTAETNYEGFARASFRPPEAGDYHFVAKVRPEEDGEVLTADILVAAREADRPMLVVDMDKTMINVGFIEVLKGDPPPMEGSVEVLNKLAQTHLPIYLTLRPDYFGPSTNTWIRRHGYPEGPLLVARFDSFVEGNKEFRRKRIRQLRERFSRIELGIGDKLSSAKVHREMGLETYHFVHLDELEEPDDYRDRAEGLRELPGEVQVVRTWEQVRAGVLEGKRFSPQRMIDIMHSRARALEKQED